MPIHLPHALEEALAVRAEHPAVRPIAGGTDLMVEVNFGHARPPGFLDLTGVAELRELDRDDGSLVIGAGVPMRELIERLAGDAPGLVAASRTVGSPQIRARATLAGNLATASPAGDALPVLVAAGASVELASASGSRRLPVGEFLVGPKRSALGPDELIRAVHLPVCRGAEQFAKVGTRNAMVIAVCAFAIRLDDEARRVGTGIGSAGPTTLRAPEAELFLGQALVEDGLWERPGALPAATAARFGELVAAAAQPIDDVRGSAAYRRHALGVLAARTATWAVADERRGR